MIREKDLKELTTNAWTPKMDKEEKHMKDKRAFRLMQKLAAGGMAEI